MKFTKIRLTGLNPFDLPIVDATPADRFILKASDGLGPPPVDASIARPLNQRGVPQAKRPQLRVISMTIALNPNYMMGDTPSSLREQIYGLLTPGYTGAMNVILMDGDEEEAGRIEGWVTKCEPNPFSKDPEVVLEISCFSSYFEALLDYHPGLIGMSKAMPSFPNVGTADTGFRMELTFLNNLSEWGISTQGNLRRFKLDYDFLVGDKLMFDTTAGQRFAQIQRGATIISMLPYITTDSEPWIQLYGGQNTFATTSPLFTWNEISYKPLFWGI